MSDHCDWPKCRQPSACTYTFGAKSWHLCEYHGDLVQDDDENVLKRARKKIGMPLPMVYPGRLIRCDENACCSFPACDCPASLVRYRQDGLQAPVCNDHKNREDYDWDGVWHTFVSGHKLDSKSVEEQPTQTTQPESPDEDEADFSEFEARLASGSYDWDEE